MFTFLTCIQGPRNKHGRASERLTQQGSYIGSLDKSPSPFPLNHERHEHHCVAVDPPAKGLTCWGFSEKHLSLPKSLSLKIQPNGNQDWEGAPTLCPLALGKRVCSFGRNPRLHRFPSGTQRQLRLLGSNFEANPHGYGPKLTTRPQVLVHAATCQGKPFGGYPIFDPQPYQARTGQDSGTKAPGNSEANTLMFSSSLLDRTSPLLLS